MDQRQSAESETRGTEHVSDDGKLTLEIKVLRSKLRTSLKCGAGGTRWTGDLRCPAPTA
jgi:hypothetical protein